MHFPHADQQRFIRLLSEVLDFDDQECTLTYVTSYVLLTCLFSLQQLHVDPVSSVVGAEIAVQASQPKSLGAEAGAVGSVQVAAAGVAVAMESPDGMNRPVGVTDVDGVLRFTPSSVGLHAFSASIRGVRCVTTISVAPARNRWLLAIVCVPLGLAVLWLQLRRVRAGRPKAVAATDD